MVLLPLGLDGITIISSTNPSSSSGGQISLEHQFNSSTLFYKFNSSTGQDVGKPNDQQYPSVGCKFRKTLIIMTPRSLFNIIIKIFGLFFLREIVNTIPQLISSLLYFTMAETVEEGLWTFIFTAVVLVFYTFLFLKLLFKTNYFLDKLKLDQGFNQEEFSFNISTSKILTIALIVTAGVILTNEIPNLCRNLFSYIQEKRMTHGITKPDFSYLIISAAKIIIGLLLIGERNRIIDFLEKQQLEKQKTENE